MQWIILENELPNSYRRVLFCDERGWIFIGADFGGTFKYKNGEEPERRITHWMPLPPLPNHIPDAKKRHYRKYCYA